MSAMLTVRPLTGHGGGFCETRGCPRRGGRADGRYSQRRTTLLPFAFPEYSHSLVTAWGLHPLEAVNITPNERPRDLSLLAAAARPHSHAHETTQEL